jgi:hypothetical protein
MMCLDVDTKLYSNTANKANRFGSKVTQKEFSNDQFSFVNVIPLAKLMLLGATTTTRKTNYALFSLYRSFVIAVTSGLLAWQMLLIASRC